MWRGVSGRDPGSSLSELLYDAAAATFISSASSVVQQTLYLITLQQSDIKAASRHVVTVLFWFIYVL